MTKMPEPYGWRLYKEGKYGLTTYDYEVMEQYVKEGFTVTVTLITTAQAETYVNERVREVLEEAARLLDPYNEEGTLGALNAKLILSLIPKEQT